MVHAYARMHVIFISVVFSLRVLTYEHLSIMSLIQLITHDIYHRCCNSESTSMILDGREVLVAALHPENNTLDDECSMCEEVIWEGQSMSFPTLPLISWHEGWMKRINPEVAGHNVPNIIQTNDTGQVWHEAFHVTSLLSQDHHSVSLNLHIANSRAWPCYYSQNAISHE